MTKLTMDDRNHYTTKLAGIELAYELHLRTGFPLAAVSTAANENWWTHVGVWAPHVTFLDVHGLRGDKDVIDEFDTFGPGARPWLETTGVVALGWDPATGTDPLRAAIVAQHVLDDVRLDGKWSKDTWAAMPHNVTIVEVPTDDPLEDILLVDATGRPSAHVVRLVEAAVTRVKAEHPENYNEADHLLPLLASIAIMPAEITTTYVTW